MKPIISVEGLGKKYVIRHEGQTHYKSLREEIFQLPKKLLRREENKEEFWALKDVSFDVIPGDRVGIIGRNGAGKSTLLKLLSRITDPTEGRITLRGRMSSLLEVGTGFHPELTGRENIFLNGAILGMSRAEVCSKFDEIVSFADVEKFLDTPVKRYSSGMYVRLAFSVAAHLESEILIIDEVLAVGDAAFQKKCLGKMEEISRGYGRTVFFVSHNMQMIKVLCNRCFLLQSGALVCDDRDVSGVVLKYMVDGNKAAALWFNDGSEMNEYFIPQSMKIVDKNAEVVVSPQGCRSQLNIILKFDLLKIVHSFNIGVACFDQNGSELFWSYHTDADENAWPKLKLGSNVICVDLPVGLFNKGRYTFYLIAGLHCIQWIYAPGRGPSVVVEIDGGYSDSPFWQLTRPGMLAPTLVWRRV